MLGWAVTYTKCQGRTLEAGVVAAMSPGLLPNMAYTGITRATRLDRAFIVRDSPEYCRGIKDARTLLNMAIKANKDCVAHIKWMRMAQELAPAEEVAEAVKLLREESAGCPLEEQVSTACIACCSALPSVRLSPCEHVAMCDRCDASFAKRMGNTCPACRGRVASRSRVFIVGM